MRVSKKKANLVDLRVGDRVRARRHALGMSQAELADSVCISIQQIRKYETGANRISASRLQDIAKVLNVLVSSFFEDAPEMLDSPLGGTGEDAAPGELADFLNNAEVLQFNRAFIKIRDAKVRRQLTGLVEALTDRTGSDPT
jgi:transcriptional regulator with XRE-family HTH domain